MNKLKAKLALRWLKHIDIDLLETRVKDLRLNSSLNKAYESLNEKMLNSHFRGGNE